MSPSDLGVRCQLGASPHSDGPSRNRYGQWYKRNPQHRVPSIGRKQAAGEERTNGHNPKADEIIEGLHARLLFGAMASSTRADAPRKPKFQPRPKSTSIPQKCGTSSPPRPIGSPELAALKRNCQKDFIGKCHVALKPFTRSAGLSKASLWAMLGAADALSNAAMAGDLSHSEACDELYEIVLSFVRRSQ